MISPTGCNDTRMDSKGSGEYGSSRGSRIHVGRDYMFPTGTNIETHKIVSPINGIVVREARPYAKGIYGGCVLKNKYMLIKMFYFSLEKTLIGTEIHQGDFLGFAQDISKKYGPDMRPHIHIQIDKVDPDVFINPWKMEGIY